MKAIVKYEAKPGRVEVRDMPDPRPGPGEVLIRLRAAGLCYSDLALADNTYVGRRPVPIPIILGHEGAGIVVESGPGVEGLRRGERVAIEPLAGCRQCQDCRSGHENMCLQWEHVGLTRDGTFAEYVVVPAGKVHRLPESVSFANAACIEPIGLVVRTLEIVTPMIGETVAIIGPGALGMLHLQAFRAAGAGKIIMVGRSSSVDRSTLLETLGADHVVAGNPGAVADEVMGLTEGRGADIVVETATAGDSVALAVDVAANRGRVALFGLYPQVSVSALKILRKGLAVYGDVSMLSRHFMRAIRWVTSGAVLAEPLIQKRFSLDAFDAARNAWHRKESVKVLFEI